MDNKEIAEIVRRNVIKDKMPEIHDSVNKILNGGSEDLDCGFIIIVVPHDDGKDLSKKGLANIVAHGVSKEGTIHLLKEMSESLKDRI